MTEKTPKQLLWDWLKAETRHNNQRKGKPVAELTEVETAIAKIPAAAAAASAGLKAMASDAQAVADAVVAVAMGTK